VADDAKSKIISYRRKQFLEQELPLFFKNIQILGMDFEEISKHYQTYIQKIV